MSRNGKVFERYLTPIEETVWSQGSRRQVVAAGPRRHHARAVRAARRRDRRAVARGARRAAHARSRRSAIDGQPVRNWSDVQHHLGKLARRTSLVYFRGSELPGVPQVELLVAGLRRPRARDADRRRRSKRTTLHRPRARRDVRRARRSGLARRRRRASSPAISIVALDDKPVAHWLDLDQRLQARADQDVQGDVEARRRRAARPRR